MPLSDEEQRLLDQIEQELAVVSQPAAAVGVVERVLQSWLAAIVELIFGVSLLWFGLRASVGFGTVEGVAGYVLIVAAVHTGYLAVDVRRRRRAAAQ
jgi:uncharacterized membrane protein